nr:hypothetical protein [uncultured Albidiferax sp.]
MSVVERSINGKSACLILLLSTCIWISPLLFNQFAWVTDLFLQYQWATQFDRSLREGIAIPRWNSASNNGLGDATFLHIHPLYYYLVSVTNVLIQDIWVSMRFVLGAAHWALGIVVYISLKNKPHSNQALVCGIVAQWMPFMMLQTIYGQSFPVLLAMPMTAWVVHTLVSPTFDAKKIFVCCAALTCAILSHILIAFTLIVCVSLTLAIWALLDSRLTTKNTPHCNITRFKLWIGVVALSMGLSAWYLVPAIFGRSMINAQAWSLGQLISPALSWQRNFIFPWWTVLQEGQTSFAVLWLTPFPAALIGLILGSAIWRARKFSSINHSTAWQILLNVWLSAGIFACAISWPIWATFGFFQQLQFPFRFVGVMSVTAALLLGHPLFSTRTRLLGAPRWLLVLGSTLLCSGILLGQAFVGGRHMVPNTSWLTGTFGQPEYLPSNVPSTWRQAFSHSVLCGNTLSGCTILVNKSHTKIFRYTSEVGQDMPLPIFFHPGWLTKLDGQQVLSSSADAHTGLLTVQAPPGTHELQVTWAGTPLEKWGNSISLVSLFALLAGLAAVVLRKPSDT